MRRNTYQAKSIAFPRIVTVWDEANPLYGKACQWTGRQEDMCVVELGEKKGYVHFSRVALGDNSHAFGSQTEGETR